MSSKLMKMLVKTAAWLRSRLTSRRATAPSSVPVAAPASIPPAEAVCHPRQRLPTSLDLQCPTCLAIRIGRLEQPLAYDAAVLATLQAMLPGHRLVADNGTLVLPDWVTARELFMRFHVPDEEMRIWPEGLRWEDQQGFLLHNGFNATQRWWIDCLFAGRLLPYPPPLGDRRH